MAHSIYYLCISFSSKFLVLSLSWVINSCNLCYFSSVNYQKIHLKLQQCNQVEVKAFLSAVSSVPVTLVLWSCYQRTGISARKCSFIIVVRIEFDKKYMTYCDINCKTTMSDNGKGEWY